MVQHDYMSIAAELIRGHGEAAADRVRKIVEIHLEAGEEESFATWSGVGAAVSAILSGHRAAGAAAL